MTNLMLRRVQIVKKNSGQKIAEYPMLLDRRSFDHYFLDKAWLFAIKEGSVIEANRIDYAIGFVEET